MCSEHGKGKVNKSTNFPCGVCGLGVQRNSILCIKCKQHGIINRGRDKVPFTVRIFNTFLFDSNRAELHAFITDSSVQLAVQI